MFEFSLQLFKLQNQIINQQLESMGKTLDQLSTPLQKSNGQDPLDVGSLCKELIDASARHPEVVYQLSTKLYTQLANYQFQSFTALLQHPTGEAHAANATATATATNSKPDKRFRNEDWERNPYFKRLKDDYLQYSSAIQDYFENWPGLEPQTRAKLKFLVNQYVYACAPTNYALSNPEVWRKTMASQGANLFAGMSRAMYDLKKNNGRLDIPMTDERAVVLGRDVATSAGKVIFQNELFQLIHYQPKTNHCRQTPLLIVPPWMNKYYILDLSPSNSFVNWLLQQKQDVFMISWVNPDEKHRDHTFEDYILKGILQALDAIELVSGESQTNVIGYCLGGILTTATLGLLAEKNPARIKSATLLTTMVDFSDTGEVSMFLDENGLQYVEKKMKKEGYLAGTAVYDTWRMLRAHELFWPHYVQQYLKGEELPVFDLLHWNADSTNLSEKVHGFVMREFYVNNRLREPGGISIDGHPIDVTKIKTPCYIFSTLEDHIAPWQTTFQTTQLFSGDNKFVLGESGHIVGVINPPSRKRYGYWTNDHIESEASTWLDKADYNEHSWWPNWLQWIAPFAGDLIDARVPGAGKLSPLESAPGSYVKKKV